MASLISSSQDAATTAGNHRANLTKAKQHIVFSVLILLVNIASFIIVLSSRHLRKMFKYNIICSISVMNISFTVAYFPYQIHLALNRSSVEPEILVTTFLEAVDYFVFPSITFLNIAAVGADFMLNRNMGMDVRIKLIISIMGITIPLLYGITAFVPFVCQPSTYQETRLTHRSEDSHIINSYKTLFNTSTFLNESKYDIVSTFSFLALVLLWVIIPLTVLIIVSTSASIMTFVSMPAMMTTYQAGNHDNILFTSMPVDGIGDDDLRPRYILDTVLSSIVAVVFCVPTFCDLVTQSVCTANGFCFFPRTPHHSFHLLKWAMAFIMPALWMLDGRFREASAKACGKLFVKSCVVY